MIRIPIRRWVREAWAEVRAAGAITPWLGRRFWYCWAVALVAPLPACWFRSPVLAVLSVAGFLLVGLLMVRSGWSARRVRSAGWVRYPNGPAVVAHLSKLLPVLLLPQFLLGMTAAFFQVGAIVPDSLPVSSLADALRLTADNLLRSQLFFDAAECFHFRLGADPSRLAGPTLVFVGRLLLDLTVIKLLVALAVGAASRARGLGDATDRLSAIDEAIRAADWPRVSRLARGIAANLEAAAMDFRTHLSPDDPHPGEAWNGLCHLREFALAAIRKRFLLADDAERAELQGLYRRLEAVAAPPVVPPAGPLPIVALVAIPLCVGSVVTTIAFLPGIAGLVGASLGVILLLGLLLGSRGGIRRLSGRGWLRPVAPERQSVAIGIWSAALLPGLMLAWARVWELLPQFAPVFGPTTAPPGFTDSLLFVVQGLLHTQILVDVFEVYNIRVARLEQVGWAGSSLAWVMRLGFDLGVLSVVFAPGVGWLRRVVIGSRVRPGLDLGIRRAAVECRPGADRLVARDLAYLREYFLHAYEMVGRDPDGVVALLDSRFDPVSQLESRDVALLHRIARGFLDREFPDAAARALDRAEAAIKDGPTVDPWWRTIWESERAVLRVRCGDARELATGQLVALGLRSPGKESTRRFSAINRMLDDVDIEAAVLGAEIHLRDELKSVVDETIAARRSVRDGPAGITPGGAPGSANLQASREYAATGYFSVWNSMRPDKLLASSGETVGLTVADHLRNCLAALEKMSTSGVAIGAGDEAVLLELRGRRKVARLLRLLDRETEADGVLAAGVSRTKWARPDAHPEVCLQRVRLDLERAVIATQLGRYEEVIQRSTDSAEQLGELARGGVDDAEGELAVSQVNAAAAYRGFHRYAEAEACLRQAISTFRQRTIETSTESPDQLVRALTQLALLRLDCGDPMGALGGLNEAALTAGPLLQLGGECLLLEVLPLWQELLSRAASLPGTAGVPLAAALVASRGMFECSLRLLAVVPKETARIHEFRQRVQRLISLIPGGVGEKLPAVVQIWGSGRA